MLSALAVWILAQGSQPSISPTGPTPFGIDYLIAGAIGTVLGALIIWLGQQFGPRIMATIRHDEPRLDDTWKTTFKEEGIEYHEDVRLVQSGHLVKGDIELHLPHSESGQTNSLKYQFEGRFRHLILAATYRSTDPSRFEQGAFVLKYTAEKTLVGQHVFWSQGTERPISSEYKWV